VAAVFLGTHTPKLDDKGRLFLPARFREELAEGVVITKGQERCLYVFKRADFEDQAAKLQTAPITAKAARDFGRMLFAGAVDDAPDKQGRVTVPAPLRSYAGLTKDCVVIGANTRLEIWDAATWAAYEEEQDVAFAEQAEEVVPGLL
jgi:MraZ protein